jgi:hypothetical protein
VRVVAVAAALLVGVSGLTACRTNVGNAATINGQRVSESDVNDYVTGSAQPIKSSDGSASIAPKPFVIDILIQKGLYRKLLVASPSGAPSTGQLSTLRRQYLAGSTAKAKVEGLGAVGYSAALDSAVVDVQVLGTLLNQEQQQGVDVSAIAAKTKYPVTVNPRYGTWNEKTLRFDAGTTSGVPAFLKLQSTSAALP